MTKSQHLFFNVLTFDLPSEPVTLYFSATENDALHRIYKDLVPENVIETLFPNGDEADHVYTSFLEETEGTQAFEIDLQSCSASLAKRYAGNQLIRYFKEVAQVPLKSGFIDEIQVWVKAKQSTNPQFDEYLKFSLKIQLRYLSRHPEIQLSYDGTSKVFKENSVELGQGIGSDKFNWVLYEGQLRRWKHLKEAEEQGEEIDYEQVFPHVNRDLAIAINLPFDPPPHENRYTRYLTNINGFVDCLFHSKLIHHFN